VPESSRSSNSGDDLQQVERITTCQRALYGYILTLVGTRAVADEVLQETNLVLCRKAAEYDGRVKFLTWACQIAKNIVRSHRNRNARNRMVCLSDSLLEDIAAEAQQMAAESDERIGWLRECLDELPPRSRRLIEGRYRLGESIRYMAAELGRAPGGVRVSLHRIRLALLECVERKAATGESS